MSTSTFRIIGVGNAGVNFLDRLLFSNPSCSGLVAINNDREALAASVVTTQIALEPDSNSVTASAEISRALNEAIEGASVLILCAGLGGRTGSSLLPEIAALSKASKILTLACVSAPFSFEGKRVQSIATETLSALEKICDGVILFDNNALASTNASTAAIGDTFALSDTAMQVAIPALLAMLSCKGPVRISRADLLSALSQSGTKISYAHGKAVGANRLHQAIELALKSPLLDRGRSLAKADAVFVLLRGPKNLSFAEAQIAMQEIERVAGEQVEIQFAISAEESDEAALELFILATTRGSKKETLKPAVQKHREHTQEKESEQHFEKAEEFSLESPVTLSVSEQPDGQVEKTKEPEASRRFTKSFTAARPKQTQGALNLTTAQRGRFDKSEPTIVEGEDLDIPTYLRLGLKLSTTSF